MVLKEIKRIWVPKKNNNSLLKRDWQTSADADLSNMIFYFGYYDQNVGALSEEEIAFLKAKNAQVLGVETGRYEIWKRVIDAFEKGDIHL